MDRLKDGATVNGEEWRVHLDGHNFLPYFSGEGDEGARDTIFYFDQPGNLNTFRVNDWKAHFAYLEGAINTAVRFAPAWPRLVNLKADPYEKAHLESEMYLRWYVPNMWIFMSIETRIKEFLGSIPDYPFQAGSSLSASNINYRLLAAQGALERLQELETIMPGYRQ